MARAERIRNQKSKDKLFALHAPEVECIGKGNARKPDEFGIIRNRTAKLSITHNFHGELNPEDDVGQAHEAAL